MINNFSSQKIQNDLFILTGYKYSISYVDKTIKRIFKEIILSKKKKFIISGSQGCGKTTLLKLIKNNFKNFYNIDPLCISLDDYYLTKKQRNDLSKRIHPLLETRGVPGTHATEKITKTIQLFDKKKYPIKIPKFDKLNDDRMPFSQIIRSKKNMIFLEGWCCGCPPISNSFLQKNLNNIEKTDSEYIWRKYYNKKLKKEYRLIFKHFEYLIYFKIPSFDCVLKWRIKQEKRLKLNKKKNINYMNKIEIKNFISYYEKITTWMMKNTLSKSDLTIKINKNQKIQSIST
ncbi:uncharacterized protein METZ01_LOCUS64935 [marine metagenome]|uniref:KAP NTPase domain-containing protein n=1 Tax=marine metagenome TaxID=408172 RepID=A0A381T976_9ZZZZ